ncbi:MAG: hypothetical protein SGARI_007380, partial [Bacillariaceae sp.]
MLDDAFRVIFEVPTFGPSEALYCVGFSNTRAESPELLQKFTGRIQSHVAQHGYPILKEGEEALADRAAMLFLTMKRNPEPVLRKSGQYHPAKGVKQVDAMLYAAYPKAQAHGKSGPYAKVTRRHKKLALARYKAAEAARAPQVGEQLAAAH